MQADAGDTEASHQPTGPNDDPWRKVNEQPADVEVVVNKQSSPLAKGEEVQRPVNQEEVALEAAAANSSDSLLQGIFHFR